MVGHDPSGDHDVAPNEPEEAAGPCHSCGTYSNDLKKEPGSYADCYDSTGKGSTGPVPPEKSTCDLCPDNTLPTSEITDEMPRFEETVRSWE